MVIHTQELLEAAAELADQQNIRATVKGSAKGALVCGAGAFIGGILGGPVGLAVGGTAGACTAAYMSRDKFRPVSHIIMHDMTSRQRQELVDHLRAAIKDIDAGDAMIAVSLLMGNPNIQKTILQTVVRYLTNQMHLQIVD
ncbi:protein C19orf12 homolog [Phlebotomus argentipes]|uniref:protein C19orf12 homolog n=1 Tax=Phlebotomus argentipes TaxID=94469 RepID=UPI002892CAEE|nr:protein C19orf12 homolog [Phlebotomus argentipes]